MFNPSPGDMVRLTAGRSFCYAWPTPSLWRKGSTAPVARMDGISVGFVLGSGLQSTTKKDMSTLLIIVDSAVGFVSVDDVRTDGYQAR